MYLLTRFLYYIFTVLILKPYSRLTKLFIKKFFNKILKLTRAYILLLKTTASKLQCMNDETK